MKSTVKRPLALLLCLIIAMFICMGIAHGIQTGDGNITLSEGVIDTGVGSLTYKLYVPASATADTPAPGVLLLHGYQNDHETCSAYAIELARRGVVVMALDEYGHGGSSAGLLNQGYVNHRVSVNFGEDSVEDGTFVEIGGSKRYRLLMNFSNLSFFDEHYTTDDAGNAITDSSGGGSALFEKPLIPSGELQDITSQLLACGADIVEINTIRKRLSAVKGGKFARACAPAKVFSIVLSDIIGDPLDMIASGPACPDSSTCEQARQTVKKYSLRLSDAASRCLDMETPKELSNVTTLITGSVRELCTAAAAAAKKLGYETHILTDQMTCQAREAGSFLASIARTHYGSGKRIAFIAGGETVVKLTGSGKGGRNQELALSAAAGIEGLENVCVFSIGSDGTDGPTDAAGGYADGAAAQTLRGMGIDIHDVLQNNDAYHALEKTGGLIFTGPTGTNVNDVSVVLLHT